MRKIIQLLICTLLIYSNIQAQSFYSAEFLTGVNSTNNLFNYYSDSSDTYATSKLSVNLTPVSFGEINLFTGYTKYNKNNYLSNLNYGAGLTLIPLSDSLPLTLYINMTYQKYSYRDVLTTTSSEFSDRDAGGMISLAYQITDLTNFRLGYSYSLLGYASDSVTDKKSNSLFAGMNFSLFGSNSIDIEGGYSFEKYDYLPEYDSVFHRTYGIDNKNGYLLLENADLKSIYLSLRYSRPISRKTGLSLSFAYKNFSEFQDSALILGSSTGYLSPWLSSYDGNATLIKIKTYSIPYAIINLGFGFWNSSYLKTLESELVYSELLEEYVYTTHTRNGRDRNDDKYRLFMSVAVPIVKSSGRLFEPSLNLDYTDNRSTIENFTYTDFTISLNLNIK